MDIAKRCEQNPLLAPKDLKAGIDGMEITCLLNPGVFRYQGKIWLLLRVAERPIQKEGVISFPIYNKEGKIEVISFSRIVLIWMHQILGLSVIKVRII